MKIAIEKEQLQGVLTKVADYIKNTAEDITKLEKISNDHQQASRKIVDSLVELDLIKKADAETVYNRLVAGGPARFPEVVDYVYKSAAPNVYGTQHEETTKKASTDKRLPSDIYWEEQFNPNRGV